MNGSIADNYLFCGVCFECKNQIEYQGRRSWDSWSLIFLFNSIFGLSHQVVNKLLFHVRSFLLITFQDGVKSLWFSLILVFNVLWSIILSCFILYFLQEVYLHLVAALQTQVNFILRIFLLLSDCNKKIIPSLNAEVEVSRRIRILAWSNRFVFFVYFPNEF